jgi:hypothetical protein
MLIIGRYYYRKKKSALEISPLFSVSGNGKDILSNLLYLMYLGLFEDRHLMVAKVIIYYKPKDTINNAGL